MKNWTALLLICMTFKAYEQIWDASTDLHVKEQSYEES